MELTWLTLTAASFGVVHTALGPDHYVPFIAMSRAGAWSLRRTLAITALCGLGHIAGSVALGAIGLGLGLGLGGLEAFEGIRGDVAGWLLLGFGLAYLAWGLRQAWRGRVHTHLHAHAGGLVHRHEHAHDGDHAHVHEAPFAPPDAPRGAVTPWVLFLIFVFGPCEVLIPLLMYPAAEHHWAGVVLVTAVFAVATLATMLAAVLVGCVGLSLAPAARFERYTHALAGGALAACGLAITLGL